MTAPTTSRPVADRIRRGALSVLREGRLRLLFVATDTDHPDRPLLRAIGQVTGHNGLYLIDHFGKPGAWFCTCRAMPGEACAHILAVQLVTGATP